MAKAGGGGGRAGGGGGGDIGISFTSGGGALYGTPEGGRREGLLTVPTGMIGGPHRQAAQDFLDRTATRLNRARSEEAASSILQQAQDTLTGIGRANRFLEPVPSLPW